MKRFVICGQQKGGDGGVILFQFMLGRPKTHALDILLAVFHKCVLINSRVRYVLELLFTRHTRHHVSSIPSLLFVNPFPRAIEFNLRANSFARTPNTHHLNDTVTEMSNFV